MHIDNFRELCEQEWRDTVGFGVELATEYLSEYEIEDGVDRPEAGANYAIERIFECVCLQEAVAYIVASGCTFSCLENTWDNLIVTSPKHIMWCEIRDALIDAGF